MTSGRAGSSLALATPGELELFRCGMTEGDCVADHYDCGSFCKACRGRRHQPASFTRSVHALVRGNSVALCVAIARHPPGSRESPLAAIRDPLVPLVPKLCLGTHLSAATLL